MSWNKINKADIVLDIEAVGTPISEKERADALASFRPPKNFKDPEKIEAKRLEYEKDSLDRLTEKRGIYLSTRRIISCAVGRVGDDGTVFDVANATAFRCEPVNFLGLS